MKKLLIFAICLFLTNSLFAWGNKGHDVVANIAEGHITSNVAKKIDKILNGHSMVYYANWMDVASHTPEYNYTKTWHYLNINENETYESMPRNSKGDVITAIATITNKLKKGKLKDDEETMYLKMLIHLVGDLHCPMHTGRLSDYGGNRVNVKMFNRPTNLHSAWDSAIVDSGHKWGYSEWAEQIDRKSDEEVQSIQAGTPENWILETHEICKQIYVDTPDGTNISYDYIEKYTPIVETQLLKGGLRLAKLLNEIYN